MTRRISIIVKRAHEALLDELTTMLVRRVLLLRMVAIGCTYETARAATGVTTQMFYVWCEDPDFAAMLASARAAGIQRRTQRLRELGGLP